MNPPTVQAESNAANNRCLRGVRVVVWILLILLTVYVVLGYIVLPFFWRHYEHHPAMADAPKFTVTGEGIPGDPLNVGLVGSKEEVIRGLLKAGWSPADPITFRSSVRIVESVLLHRSYEDAPVSNLYLWGRKQDLAFEQLVGGSAKERHHVRFWESKELGSDGRPLWIGAATFDRKVGLSHRTGQITHHIAPDIDAERDKVIGDLQNVRQIVRVYQVTGIGPTISARNGGGDRYYTDGEVTIGVLSPQNTAQTSPPVALPSPGPVKLKNRLWSWVRNLRR